MTVNQAAARLGVAASTLRIQIAKGKLHSTKRGRDHWITDAEVERYRAESLGRHQAARSIDARS
jgi:excisionase family DNA binding protein